MQTVFEIMSNLKEITRQINLMEDGFEFQLRNVKSSEEFRFQKHDKVYQNMIEYLYNKQTQLIEDLKQALAKM